MPTQEETDSAALVQIKAICTLAAANFPAATDLTIAVHGGPGNGSIRLPYYVLLRLLEVKG